jgi:transposase
VRQRAHGVFLSFQGYTPQELAHIFHVDRITLYHWFDAWETRRFPGLYDRQGKGRPPSFTPEQKDEMRQGVKLFPKNLNKIGACIRDRFGLDVSQQTIKRVLKSFEVSWRRMRKKVKKRPDPETDQEKREALETLIEEDREGIIDLRYVDASGFCFVPYIPYAWQDKGDTIALESRQSKRVNVLGFLNKRHE